MRVSKGEPLPCPPLKGREFVLYAYSLTGWLSTLLPRGTLQQLLPEFQQIFLVRIFLQTCFNETKGEPLPCPPLKGREFVLYAYSLTGWLSTLLPRGTLQQLLPEFQQIFLVRIFLQTCFNETKGLLTIIVTACTDAEGNQQTGFRPKSLHLRQ